MDLDTKERIHQLVNEITDEDVLLQVMEDVMFYAQKKDPVLLLDTKQQDELKQAIEEGERGDVIALSAFQKATSRWKDR
ncbi:MAG: hypothetical protein MUC38_13005 [Cyclobacteriaceae bacterium]|jgi:hypothetical protein|nr:hypothetical protein [Cyclobacteriaceae bacterium]